MKKSLSAELWVDGGVIGSNPSKTGGTWAICITCRGKFVRHWSGTVTPEEFGIETISNNLTELLAAVKGLSQMAPDWDGTIYTDSKITLLRITNSTKFNGIPNSLRLETLNLRRGRKWQARLVAGHPTLKELESGVAKRNGLPVSPFNVWCDQECQRLAREFLAAKGLK